MEQNEIDREREREVIRKKRGKEIIVMGGFVEGKGEKLNEAVENSDLEHW